MRSFCAAALRLCRTLFFFFRRYCACVRAFERMNSRQEFLEHLAELVAANLSAEKREQLKQVPVQFYRHFHKTKSAAQFVKAMEEKAAQELMEKVKVNAALTRESVAWYSVDLVKTLLGGPVNGYHFICAVRVWHASYSKSRRVLLGLEVTGTILPVVAPVTGTIALSISALATPLLLLSVINLARGITLVPQIIVLAARHCASSHRV